MVGQYPWIHDTRICPKCLYKSSAHKISYWSEPGESWSARMIATHNMNFPRIEKLHVCCGQCGFLLAIVDVATTTGTTTTGTKAEE